MSNRDMADRFGLDPEKMENRKAEITKKRSTPIQPYVTSGVTAGAACMMKTMRNARNRTPSSAGR